MKTRPEIQVSCKVEQSPLTFTYYKLCILAEVLTAYKWENFPYQMFKVTVSSLFPICFLFGLHMLKTKTCVSQDSKNCFEKQFLLPECNFVPATIFPAFHQLWNVHGSNHCLELIFSFEDTKFKVDHKLSHSSVRRYIRFGHLKHIGKVRLFAILHCI